MKILTTLFLMITMFMSACQSTESNKGKSAVNLKEEAVNTLRTVLNDQKEWVKVHAAEFLLWSGHPEGVRTIYLEEEKKYGQQSPYRIGIWRVLAQETEKPDEKKIWTDKIIRAFLDTNGADRIHAAETLAKLHISPFTQYPEATAAALKSTVKSLSLYTRWSVSFASEDSSRNVRKSFLHMATSGEEEALPRRLAAYVIRNSGELPDTEWELFAKTALTEPDSSGLRNSLLTAAVIAAPGLAARSGLYQQVFEAFLHAKHKADKGTRMDIAAGLAEKGNADDLPFLATLLKNEHPLGTEADDADVRASAAYAILKIEKRLSANENRVP